VELPCHRERRGESPLCGIPLFRAPARGVTTMRWVVTILLQYEWRYPTPQSETERQIMQTNAQTIPNQAVERCIEECLQCSRWCSQCRAESLNEDPIMMRDCIRLCNECLELCRTCVALLTGSSEFAHRVCRICSELCTECASECGKYDGETMRNCAQACRQCAATCAEIAQGGAIRRAAA